MEPQNYAPIALNKEHVYILAIKITMNRFLQTKKAQAVNKRTNELSFRVKEGLNIRVSQNVKLVVDSAVAVLVLIDAEAALKRVSGTGSHVITIVIIIIDTIIKETRGNRQESLSRARKIRTVQATDLIACKLLKDR